VIEPGDPIVASMAVAANGGGGDPRRGLTSGRRKLALTVHVVAAVGLSGVSTVLLVAGLHAATRDDPQEAHAIYALLRLLTVSLDLPLASITLLSGVLLALTSGWGILRYWWVVAKLTIFLATLVLGVALIGPSIETLLDVTEAGDPGESGARSRLIAAAGVQVAMLLAAATLGVFKPGRARRRSGSEIKRLPDQPF
jgi:hypothetical protein